MLKTSLRVDVLCRDNKEDFNYTFSMKVKKIVVELSRGASIFKASLFGILFVKYRLPRYYPLTATQYFIWGFTKCFSGSILPEFLLCSTSYYLLEIMALQH